MCRFPAVADRLVLFAFAVVLPGCAERPQGPDRLPVVPVRGTVLVTDLPASGVTVQFHSVENPIGEVKIYAAKPKAITGGDGAFAMSTYIDGDGVAAGKYRVTFEWRKFDRLKNGYSGPDHLDGKYSDPESSEFTVTVTGDEEEGLELEPFKLTP
jgi:hypothetical protein